MSNLNEQSKYKHIEWNKKAAEEFRNLALIHVEKINSLIGKGYFDRDKEEPITIDLEQETMVLNLDTGEPLNIEPLFDTHPLARPDTTEYFCEFDGAGVTTIKTAEDISNFRDRFISRFKSIHQAVKELSGDRAYPFSIGTLPFKGEVRDFLLKDPQKQIRYALMEKLTNEVENIHKDLTIKNDLTGEVFTDKASNLSAMARCASTQPHFGFPTPEQTLEAYNVSIAITPVLISLFSDSPFVGEVDSGLVCSRLELLGQSEQIRGGLAVPADSIAEHYKQVLNQCVPPCVIDNENAATAFTLSYGTTHHSTRIITDIENATTRIEVRCLDSLPVDLAMQAIVFCLGVFNKLKAQDVPTYEETKLNFNRAIKKGLQAEIQNKGIKMSMQEFSLQLIQDSKEGLKEMKLEALIPEFIEPLEKFVKYGINRSDITRSKVKEFEGKGMTRKGALVAMLKDKVQVFE